ncbi:hypothetical protein CFC35_41405 [Streptomyces sp. FBKL.4005]|nr:hypothetical protein CFC35_41405 [Streptomyces sp. FBKL.4005]
MIVTDVRNRFVTESQTRPAETAVACRAEWEAGRASVPAQPVDGGRHGGADSEQTERGTR